MTTKKIFDTFNWAELVNEDENFENYKQIIMNENNSVLKYVSGITQKHHILPKSYFKKHQLKIDNSEDNIVILYHRDHILAHYFLALCAKDGWFKYATEFAVCSMINEAKLPSSKDELMSKMPEYEKLYKDFCHRQSLKKSLGNGPKTTLGKKSIYNKQLNVVKFVLEDELQFYLNSGWVLGGKPLSEEAKKKIGRSNSIALLGKKTTIEANEKRKESLRRKWQSEDNNWIHRKKRTKESYESVSKSLSGRIAIINLQTGKRTRVKKDELEKYLNSGWIIGWKIHKENK